MSSYGFGGGYHSIKCTHEPKHEWSQKRACARLRMKEIKRKKRVRHVVPTGEIAHLWAHQVQDSARNGCKSLFFEGKTIFSFGHHYPAARHVEFKGKKAVLVTNRKSSSSTSGHMAGIRSSLPKTWKVFEVRNVCEEVTTYGGYGSGRYGGGSFNTDKDPDHAVNTADLVKQIEEHVGKAKRATSVNGKEWNTKSALTLLAELKAYIKFFQIKKVKLPSVPKPSKKVLAEMEARAKQLEATKAERTRVRLQKNIEAWKAGADVRFGWRDSQHIPVMLRVKTFGADQDVAGLVGRVETSKGAQCEIAGPAGAARLWRFLKALKDAGKKYKRNGHSERIGHFTVDSFDGQVLKVGCHSIDWSECERIAPEVEALCPA